MAEHVLRLKRGIQSYGEMSIMKSSNSVPTSSVSSPGIYGNSWELEETYFGTTPISIPHPYRASIPPVLDSEPRPLWSVMIPTYHCAAYLRQTLTSVLAQDLGPELMQIEVVDDHSTCDDPGAVVEELGSGRVKFYRQPENVGYIRNFETCLQRSQGRLIHLLHGDDWVREGFYAKLGRAFELHPGIGAAFCRHILIDEEKQRQKITWLEQPQSGILSDWLPRIVVEQRIQTPSIVVRRNVYERLGGFDRRFSCAGEDWEMWIRIAAEYPIWYEVEPLAIYRIRSGSLSGRSRNYGQYTRDLSQAIDIVGSYLARYLPGPAAETLLSKAREDVALSALRQVRRLIERQDWGAALAQSRAAIQCSHSTKVMAQIARLYGWAVAWWMLRRMRM